MAGVQGEEFDEGDVWNVLQDPAPAISTPPTNRRAAASAGGSKGKNAEGSRSGPPSAPLDIPAGGEAARRRSADEEEEDGDGGEEVLPPHEWLARKMERVDVGGASSPPEVRGGRSKGREMRKIRDAVLPKTAFSDQQ